LISIKAFIRALSDKVPEQRRAGMTNPSQAINNHAQMPTRYDHFFVPLILFLGFVAGMAEWARSPDWRMVIQGWTFAGCMAAVGVWYMWMYAGRTPQDERGPYADTVIKAGVVASMFWGIAGMLVGLILALQLSFPNWFYFPDLSWTNFGRMRPLHTSAVIFAFGGNVLIAMQGVPRISMARSSSRATRTPESELSTTSATHSRLKSSTTVSTRNLRPEAKASDTKSSDQRWFDPCGIVMGALVPSARLRPPRFLTISLSSR
jgi:hypothetical protein